MRWNTTEGRGHESRLFNLIGFLGCVARNLRAGAVSAFLTPLDVRLVDPTANDHTGQWQLLAELHYWSDRASQLIIAPLGFSTDFASVPRALILAWGLFGARGMRAAVIHDFVCRQRMYAREKCDRIYFEALIEDGIPMLKAIPMYMGVSAYTASGMWKEDVDQPDFEVIG